MIYKKESNFPYPILAPFTEDYPEGVFNLEVSLLDLDEFYRFDINYDLKSKFIKKLLINKEAKIYLVIQSKDQKFFELNETSFDIKKSRISLDNRTQLQLFIINTRRISFKDNRDLDAFYDDYKHKIFVDKYATLALSNIEAFDGELKKPFELFEYTYRADLKSEFKVEFKDETINLVFRDPKFNFIDLPKQHHPLNNHYVYLGLQYALLKFITDEAEIIEEGLDINDMDVPENPLYKKLYDLLSAKNVEFLHFENVDKVINDISDNIILRHSQKIREVMQNDY